MLQGQEKDPLIAALREKEDPKDSSFWSFKRATQRKGAHALLHYPAMMVPSLQGLIMRCVQTSQPTATKVLDPFVGSGTVLVEAMEHGLDFRGVDINPLAGLACLVKSGPYYLESFNDKAIQLLVNISIDKKTHKPREFSGRDKWLDLEVAQYLEKAAHHISAEPATWARRLFWLALCRVVRATCKSRKSTYKLHIVASADKVAVPDAHAQFVNVLEQFQEHLAHEQKLLKDKKLLKNGCYTGSVEVAVGNNQDFTTEKETIQAKYDLVMTSPPYGDNVTTIPYGQFSYLPLQWVDINDIDADIDLGLISNTHATDSASLGGSFRGVEEKASSLRDNYGTAATFLDSLKDERNGRNRFAAFFSDLDKSVDGIAQMTKPNGIHAWTIANRRICGLEAPMVPMMLEMLRARNMNVIGSISRGIHFKKMAHRNSLTATMTSETILLARKGAVTS
jgi:hypothetical protein